ncbi:cationic peroxidase SPC4-like [Asparagus officinalis]|uniref:cationic peroxidase SPC4-like n=1 Tax=Asparagus officinalis TaxID=4686 RepID=UPI00098E08EB|nr:cationic peroxidase SPC4-like [Asparagus officinalis]
MASPSSFFLFSLIALSLSLSSEAGTFPPPAKGLSYTFYSTKCPNLESIVRNYLSQELQKDIGLAAGLLRIHFHDCFVQGCDASVLLTGSGSEQSAPPNLTLRQSAFKVIDDLQTLIERACGRVVSCADIVTLAARDSVALDRRESFDFFTHSELLADITLDEISESV